jgi:putative RecB family exonuclease
LDRVPAPDRVELFTGKRVHEALEKLYSQVMAGSVPSFEEVLGVYERKWTECWRDSVLVPEGASATEFKQHGEQCLKNYFFSHSPFDSSKTLAVEKKVSTRVGGRLFVGVIDRLAEAEAGIELHDYKTSSCLPAQEYFAEDRQLALYQLALERESGLKGIELVWDFVGLDQEVRVVKSRASLEKAERDTVSLIEAVEESVEEGEFEKNEGQQCQRCVYAKHCGK